MADNKIIGLHIAGRTAVETLTGIIRAEERGIPSAWLTTAEKSAAADIKRRTDSSTSTLSMVADDSISSHPSTLSWMRGESGSTQATANPASSAGSSATRTHDNGNVLILVPPKGAAFAPP